MQDEGRMGQIKGGGGETKRPQTIGKQVAIASAAEKVFFVDTISRALAWLGG